MKVNFFYNLFFAQIDKILPDLNFLSISIIYNKYNYTFLFMELIDNFFIAEGLEMVVKNFSDENYYWREACPASLIHNGIEDSNKEGHIFYNLRLI